jgi:superfamily I DNA and/or RNA helicase
LLEHGLKEAGLPWEDKCFNIDSFQGQSSIYILKHPTEAYIRLKGNEDDYIIISLVRSAKLGFLRESRRTNVMLTRCKKSMIICTSRKFIEGPARDSLVGKLSKSLPRSAWLEDGQVQDGVRLFT